MDGLYVMVGWTNVVAERVMSRPCAPTMNGVVYTRHSKVLSLTALSILLGLYAPHLLSHVFIYVSLRVSACVTKRNPADPGQLTN
jgi:hypothetical protein